MRHTREEGSQGCRALLCCRRSRRQPSAGGRARRLRRPRRRARRLLPSPADICADRAAMTGILPPRCAHASSITPTLCRASTGRRLQGPAGLDQAVWQSHAMLGPSTGVQGPTSRMTRLAPSAAACRASTPEATRRPTRSSPVGRDRRATTVGMPAAASHACRLFISGLMTQQQLTHPKPRCQGCPWLHAPAQEHASRGEDDAVRLGRAHDVDAVLYKQRRAAAQHLLQQHRRLVQLATTCQPAPCPSSPEAGYSRLQGRALSCMGITHRRTAHPSAARR